MCHKPNTNKQHLRAGGIINILTESGKNNPESAMEVDDISAYPAHSDTSGSNRRASHPDLLAMISHKMRVFLKKDHWIIQFTIKSSCNPEQHKHIGTIQKSGDDLLSLFNKMMDYSNSISQYGY